MSARAMTSTGCSRSPTDVGDGWSNADLDTRVTLFSEFALEEFVQFGIEDAVGNKFPLL